ncbi:MAG: VWA domain-containing protein [Gemmataceae bacterium]|nr:VWA domain-containing protein [Gemmataceae bacterium]
MRTRHKIPTIFNLSMVDVLCCALGCVILLWLLNFREAKRRSLIAGETAVQLADARAQLTAAERDISNLMAQRDAALAQLLTTGKERDHLRGDIADLDKKLAALRRAAAEIEDRLSRKSDAYQAAARDLTIVEKDRLALQMLLRDKDALARAAALAADDLALRLRDADARAKKLLALSESLEGQLAMSRDKSTGAETRLLALEKELLDSKKRLGVARLTIDELQDEKKLLAHQIARAKADADNRFAGIALTGRRVVFLVDMSGSMDYVDEQTQAPDKWAGVRETLAKIMRSLPELEKFQVILFARDASYLMGNEDRWIAFDPKASVEQATKALAATKPKGATNMYAALDAAFRFRADGLDTIYLLSDGLPNVGTGLTPEQASKLKETEKCEILSNHVRKMLKTTWNKPGLDRSRVRINTIGFFYESPDVGAFLWALARENDGSFVGMSKP